MAEPLDISDLAGHTGAGCAHTKEAAIRAAVLGVLTSTAVRNALKTACETACPGVTWTNARLAKAVRRVAEEM